MADKTKTPTRPAPAPQHKRIAALERQVLQYNRDIARMEALRERTAKILLQLKHPNPAPQNKTTSSKTPNAD